MSDIYNSINDLSVEFTGAYIKKAIVSNRSGIEMIYRIFVIFGIFLSLISLCVQDNLPTYSAVQYEVRADSLLKTNEPQDLIISISASSSGGLAAFELKIYDLKVLWTLVSAKLNDEPIWLINTDSKSDKQNVLAWKYESEENLLRLYPSDWQSGYNLELMVRLSILQPGSLANNDSKSIALEADLGGQRYQCSPSGSGNDMTFKRKVRNTR